MKKIVFGVIIAVITLGLINRALFIKPKNLHIVFEEGSKRYELLAQDEKVYELKYLNSIVKSDGKHEYILFPQRKMAIARSKARDVYEILGLTPIFSKFYKKPVNISEEEDVVIERGDYKGKGYKNYELVVSRRTDLPKYIKLYNDDSSDSLVLSVKSYKTISGKYFPEEYVLYRNSNPTVYRILEFKRVAKVDISFDFLKKYKIIRR